MSGPNDKNFWSMAAKAVADLERDIAPELADLLTGYITFEMVSHGVPLPIAMTFVSHGRSRLRSLIKYSADTIDPGESNEAEVRDVLAKLHLLNEKGDFINRADEVLRLMISSMLRKPILIDLSRSYLSDRELAWCRIFKNPSKASIGLAREIKDDSRSLDDIANDIVEYMLDPNMHGRELCKELYQAVLKEFSGIRRNASLATVEKEWARTFSR